MGVYLDFSHKDGKAVVKVSQATFEGNIWLHTAINLAW